MKVMKHLTAFLTCLAITGVLFISCSKKETPQTEKQTLYTDLYSKGGVVHNELLNKFANKLMKSDSKLSLKLNNIALKYINTRTGTIPRSVAPSTQELTELQNEINQAVAEEVLPVSISYLQGNGFYQQFEEVGIQDPESIINSVADDIYETPSFSNETYLNEISFGKTLAFKNFVSDLKNLIESGSSSNLLSQIDQLKNSYLQQITDEVEALAIINGCETAKASFEYWNSTTNTTYWDDVVTNIFSPSLQSMVGKTLPRRVTNDHRDIIVADAVGAIGGVVEGAVIGAAAGPGGAMVVGTAGMILRGAQASAGEYVLNKLKSWLFD
ncbi:hypothetical protein [Niabella digestorum]|jgi:hypothetical protein